MMESELEPDSESDSESDSELEDRLDLFFFELMIRMVHAVEKWSRFWMMALTLG